VQITVAFEYLDQFGDALDRLNIKKAEPILLAVSGGPDSLAMLLLAARLGRNPIKAATVDHGLRAESADEAAYVADICKKLAVPHILLAPEHKISGNIQSSAREARYALLAAAADEADCPFIATAHHGDDQLETMMMRLARGSGVDGLAAIRHRNGRIIRPLLGFSKSELEKICVDAGFEPVRDPSNDNIEFDRVAMRQWLAQSDHPFDLERIDRTAHALSDVAEALAWMTDSIAEQRVSQNREGYQYDARQLPRELKRRLLLHCIAKLDPKLHPRGDAIDHLLIELNAGRSAMIGNILCKGGETWLFSEAPPRRT
jgi:tRNA(Ile)-lysidine synthase